MSAAMALKSWRHWRSSSTMTDAWLLVVSGNVLLLFEVLMVLGDEFNACSRQPRTRLTADIPCNFSDVMYCSTPGSDYPWQPLIKFLNDNRGLMKRMYGDTRQSVLLRHEIESHKIRVTTAAARSLELDETTFAGPETTFFEEENDTFADVTPSARAREGVNACPSQVEVVSPYWANNTRGEAVAILNVYPFEQFVYFEKCTDENQQMYCREGCRCEQQYGLQRLLAFDPRNECRGIFSEWFRFPSCCVCRCYDVTQSSTTRMKGLGESGAALYADGDATKPANEDSSKITSHPGGAG